jgi:hypothetical protein
MKRGELVPFIAKQRMRLQRRIKVLAALRDGSLNVTARICSFTWPVLRFFDLEALVGQTVSFLFPTFLMHDVVAISAAIAYGVK